jgi:hypothetical protein
MSERALQIHSYRLVFELERRIHHVDRFRIPLPYGLPLRSLAYAAVTLVAVLVLQGLPLVGDVLGVAPAPVRLAVLPVGAAVLLTRMQIDGRSAHVAAACWLGYVLAPRRVSGFRASQDRGQVRLGDMVVVPDGRGSRWRRASIAGPASVSVRYPFKATRRGRELRLNAIGDLPDGAGKQIQVPAGGRVVLR